MKSLHCQWLDHPKKLRGIFFFLVLIAYAAFFGIMYGGCINDGVLLLVDDGDVWAWASFGSIQVDTA